MKAIIRRLRGEDGSAMTEFVITLPVFIMIFSFAFGLYTKTRDLNRVRYIAATEMWENAMQVHRDGTTLNFDHMQPGIAATNAQSIISGSGSYSGDTQQQLIITGLASQNTGREMGAGSGIVGGTTADPNNETSLDFAESIGEDGLIPPMPPNNTAVFVFVGAIARSIGVTRHAGIIGTRYGAVEGEHTQTVTVASWGPSINFKAQYDVLVSPISYPGGFADEYFVVGTSRLLADQDPCLETVLEISTSMSDC